MGRVNSLEKTLMLGKTEGRRKKGSTEDEMVGWHHWLSGREFEQTPEDTEGLPGCCSSWSRKELDMAEQLNNQHQHTMGYYSTTKRYELQDFPGGPVVKNPPSKEGTWVPSLVRELRSHMPWGNQSWVPGEAHMTQRKILCAATKTQCSQVNKWINITKKGK